MDIRRATASRPATTEEVECWAHTVTSLTVLSRMNPDTTETIGRVNRWISTWPTDDSLSSENYEDVKSKYNALASGLHKIQTSALAEAKAIEDAMEQISILMALRNASEPNPSEKRNKRLRGPSPSSTSGGSQQSVGVLNRVANTANSSRSSVGPTPIPFSREPKARREALAKQLPLREGRKVAFHPPPKKPGEGGGVETDENTWMLAVVTKCINQDKNRYEVQDIENQENGLPGLCYNTTLRAIIPLPDPQAMSDNPSHLNAYPEFPAGSTVLALYPDTSCFYRAQVVASPKDMQPSGRGAPGKHVPTYKLKFEDDDDQVNSVTAQWVVEWPRS